MLRFARCGAIVTRHGIKTLNINQFKISGSVYKRLFANDGRKVRDKLLNKQIHVNKINLNLKPCDDKPQNMKGCLPPRLLQEFKPIPKTFVTPDSSQNKPQASETSINKNVLKTPTAGDPCPPPPPASDNTKYIIAAACAAGGIGLLYYFTQKGEEPIATVQQTTVPPSKRVPESSSDIPKEVPYLLIGGGTASFTAFRAIKSHEPKAKVLVISSELEIPYMRPPLSKEMWYNDDAAASDKLRFRQWNGAERSIFYEPPDFYVEPLKLLEQENGGVSICRGYKVVKLDVVNHKAILDDNTEITYGKCLIATGATPKNLPVIESSPQAVKQKISFYKNIADFKCLKRVVDKSNSIAIIGGGFLGSELSCALAHYGRNRKLNVYQLFHEKGNMGKVLPEYLSQWTTERVKEEGVNVLTSAQIKSANVVDKKLKLELTDGRTVLVDHAIVAVGSEPNTELATTSGLEVNKEHGGFVVNAELEARKNVFVAGDAACFYDVKLGRRRVEHHDHAVVSGRLAGENMVGLHKPFTHQSMFWSDLGPKVGYEAIGICDASLPTTGVFAKETEMDHPSNANMEEKIQIQPSIAEEGKEKISSTETSIKTVQLTASNTRVKSEFNEKDNFGKGVIFYLNDNDRVVGILLWNIFNRISIARKIIAQDTNYDDLNEVAKLFDLFESQEQKNS